MNESNNHKSRVGLMTILTAASSLGAAHSFPGSPWSMSLSMTETDEKLQDADLEQSRRAEARVKGLETADQVGVEPKKKGKAHV